MFDAVVKLIIKLLNLSEMTRTQLQQNLPWSDLSSHLGVGLMSLALSVIVVALPAARLEAKQESALSSSNTATQAADPSCAHIVIGQHELNAARLKNSANQNAPLLPTFTTLPEIVRQTMKNHFSKTAGGAAAEFKVEPKFMSPAGVFVTLSKRGKTRACWGSVYPREANIAKETAVSTLGALSKDYRFKPINAVELNDLKVQVTVVRSLEAVKDVKSINPFTDGIFVRSAGRGGVILPGEAVDAYYEFVLARLKAGIKPNEPCQIYRIRADIYD